VILSNNGYAQAIFKGFYTREDAALWLKQLTEKKHIELAPELLDS